MPGLDFLDGADAPQTSAPAISEAPESAITVETAQPETPAEQPSGPVRGPDGKFVARTPAEAPQEPAQAEQPAPAPAQAQQPAEPQHAPITALLDEREKRQAAERRLQELEAQLRRSTPAEPQAIPDPYEDPDGFAQFQQQQIEQRIYQTNLQWSRRIAEVQHTPEVVSQAHEWGVQRCNEDPFFNQKVQSSPDPYGFVIGEWKREQLLSQVQPDEFEQFRAWKASQGQGAPQPAAQPAIVNPPPPPRSQAATPSAGASKPGEQPVGAGVAFGGVFSQG